MTPAQISLCLILAGTLFLFLRGGVRHDVVAATALITSVVAGLVPAENAFDGFGHPAVVTVACVLVLSRALQSSGAVDMFAHRVLPAEASTTTMVAMLAGLAALLSAFMNNIGALALLMPIAVMASQRMAMPPGRLLMPMAFGSILGGMTTLIGTPPNLIVSGYRRDAVGEAFRMFDFAPVGVAIALVGLAFISLIGWRLVPVRKVAVPEDFESGAYFTEARVGEGSRAANKTVREVEALVEQAEMKVLGIIRHRLRLRAPPPRTRIRSNDVLILRAEPEALGVALSELRLELAQARRAEDDASAGPETVEGGDSPRTVETEHDGDMVLTELVVTPTSRLIGRTGRNLQLRARFRINLIALSREDQRRIARLAATQIEAGDVLLVQGTDEAIAEFAGEYGCLPLAERTLPFPDRRQMRMAIAIMVAAIASAATGVLSAPVAFVAGVVMLVVSRVMPARSIYDAVDWSVVVLLACLLPVAGAMIETGTADLLAHTLVQDVAQGHSVLLLAMLLVVTMTLSDLINNAATVAMMAPIALGAATSLQADPDAFLMAVAIGGSCAFLTPIGHQNNTLILGPGGFRFGDYWRLGLPVEVIVVLVGLPTIIAVWGI